MSNVLYHLPFAHDIGRTMSVNCAFRDASRLTPSRANDLGLTHHPFRRSSHVLDKL